MTNTVSTSLADYDTKFITDTVRLIDARTNSAIIDAIRDQTGIDYKAEDAYPAGFGALAERTRVIIRRLQAAEARGHAADQETLSAIEQAGMIPWPVPADA